MDRFCLRSASVILCVVAVVFAAHSGAHADADNGEDGELVSPERLEMFADELPDMPRIRGYTWRDGVARPRTLSVGMFEKEWGIRCLPEQGLAVGMVDIFPHLKWAIGTRGLYPGHCGWLQRFHRDLPPTRVFAFGSSRHSATIPGPTIEVLQGVPTRVRWSNHLPSCHILPWDPTIHTAAATTRLGGIPTVVHLHGGITAPSSDGNPNAWFTAGHRTTGPAWLPGPSTYPNAQEPGNLWYHDHAMGLTRVNLLAGLLGAYVIRNPAAEQPLGMPSGPTYDRHLVVFDRSFYRNGSVYLNATGNNPSIHPQWQPEYFGDVVLVNGKVWPVLRVSRRRYRFRVINASNARFFRFSLTGGLWFVHVGSDSMYLTNPQVTRKFLLAPSEIADVVVDFARTNLDEVLLRNSAPYPFPSGAPTEEGGTGVVMKFVVDRTTKVRDDSRIPQMLLEYPKPQVDDAIVRRFIAMYEYGSSTGEPTHLYLNGRPYEAPVTEMPRVGTSEVWDVINLTADNHPLHVHLALIAILEQRKLRAAKELRRCMMRENDAARCAVDARATGGRKRVRAHERGWKNVVKTRPGYLTRILVRFALVGPNGSDPYPFDASGEPGYVYHCHILDHEDNEMMRPMVLVK